MKLLNIILSIYLTVLSCLPCSDLEISHSAISVDEHKIDKDQNSHDEDDDLCSPFCVCNCCGTQALSFFSEITFEFNKNTLVIKSPLPTYKSILSSNFFGSIWQPPQIV